MRPIPSHQSSTSAYIIREQRRGRPLSEILRDRFVVENAGEGGIDRLVRTLRATTVSYPDEPCPPAA